jgi:hypothetical protein
MVLHLAGRQDIGSVLILKDGDVEIEFLQGTWGLNVSCWYQDGFLDIAYFRTLGLELSVQGDGSMDWRLRRYSRVTILPRNNTSGE